MNPAARLRRQRAEPAAEIPARLRSNPVARAAGRASAGLPRGELVPGGRVNGQPIGWKLAAAALGGPLCIVGAMTHPLPWARVGLGLVGAGVIAVDGAHVLRHYRERLGKDQGNG